MAKKVLKKFEKFFFEKNGRAPPPGWPLAAEKITKIFIHHKLQNGEGILKKFQNLFFSKKMGVPPPSPALQGDLGRWKNPKILIHHKLQNGEGILKKSKIYFFRKNGRAPLPPSPRP